MKTEEDLEELLEYLQENPIELILENNRIKLSPELEKIYKELLDGVEHE